ncbi:hypothetical protein [Methyloglobulus sp.]|uniref:hypothetical protein n=1 Tax=Methyloglobulus sp. TaxID=2518622 RepID=UPI0032B7D334
MIIQSLKPLAIALMLALLPLSVSTVSAGSDNDNHHHNHAFPPPPLVGVNKYKYTVGDRGPGGGFIFFVDYYNQYPGFTYLEAAPTGIAPVVWCNLTETSIPAVAGWSAKGVGKGQANTTAMLGVCTSGAANEADLYLTRTKSDWFLPSLGEAKLMYNNLLEAGVGNFESDVYWSSTEFGSNFAWLQNFVNGDQVHVGNKGDTFGVRAVRAF